jgi:hypothetical protein
MTVDWNGQIRMDPSSVYAMARMFGLKDRFDVAFASDTDADRHGIVSCSHGLPDPNHYLCVAISYLFTQRPHWSPSVAVGKTVVSSSLIDRVAKRLGGRLVEVPVGTCGLQVVRGRAHRRHARLRCQRNSSLANHRRRRDDLRHVPGVLVRGEDEAEAGLGRNRPQLVEAGPGGLARVGEGGGGVSEGLHEGLSGAGRAAPGREEE